LPSHKAPLDDYRFLLMDAFHVGFGADYGDFSVSAAIVRALGISRISLLTNKPGERRALSDAGSEVVARIPCEVAPTSYSPRGLRGRKEKMSHRLSLRLTLSWA
jgi:GTP cyclohydrolase II